MMRPLFWLYRALAAGLLGIGPAAAQFPVPAHDPYFGMHIHRADAGTAWPTAPLGAWRLWDLGARWPELEPQPGRWQFERLDRYVALAGLTRVDLLLPLGSSPAWASARPQEKSSYGLGQAAEPARLDDWRRYVRTVAERYRGRIRHYEIWNEVNDKGFYTGSPEKMVELTCAAHAILHAVDPDNRLVSPSFIGAGSEPEQLERFLRLGGKACVDIVAYHFYVPHREPEEIVPLVQRVRTAMQRQGLAHLPLWNTESGWWLANADGTDRIGADKRWRRVDSGEGAAVVARTLILGRWAGLERFYWYAWDNRRLGLIEPDGRLKPAGRAYATVARWLQGATPDCSSSAHPGSDPAATAHPTWVCQLPPAADGRRRRIAWTRHASDRPTYTLPAGERLRAVEQLDGGAAVADGRTYTLAYEPVLLFSEGP